MGICLLSWHMLKEQDHTWTSKNIKALPRKKHTFKIITGYLAGEKDVILLILVQLLPKAYIFHLEI